MHPPCLQESPERGFLFWNKKQMHAELQSDPDRLTATSDSLPWRARLGPLRHHQNIILSLLGFLILASPAVPLANASLPIYDERRIFLVVLLCLSGMLTGVRRPFSVNPCFPAIFCLVAALGLAGTFAVATTPAYAALELTQFILVVSACLLLGVNRPSESYIRRFLLPVLAGSAIFFGIVTLMVLAAGWAAEGHQPPWPEPLHNFINRRFMNDWQTWLLPLLPAVLFAQVGRCWNGFHRCLSLAYFGLLWALLLYSLGRATLYAQISCVLLIPLLFGRNGFRWSAIQIVAASLGLLLLILAFGMNPFSSAGAATDRLVSLDSPGRIELWALSWELIREHPLLGVGPMHFAAQAHATNAHPHNFVLQFAVEWGIPATIILFGTLAWAAWKWLRFAQTSSRDSDCPPWKVFLLISLTASMAAAAANSLLAGTAVMPMSQIMLILIVGLACALYEKPSPAARQSPRLAKAWLALVAAATLWLGGFTSYELVNYLDNHLEGTEFVGGGWYPRFWRQGRLLPDQKE